VPNPCDTAPVPIVPEPARSVVSARSVMSPSAMGELVASITPARFTADWVLAVRPLPKVEVPPAVPTVRLPVLRKVPDPMVLVEPPSTTSKAPAAASRKPLGIETLPVTVAVPVCEALPRVRISPAGVDTEPTVIAPEPLIRVVSAKSWAAPRVRAVFVVAIVPAVVVLLGPAVVSRPPVNVASVPTLPIRSFHVLSNLVALVMVVVPLSASRTR